MVTLIIATGALVIAIIGCVLIDPSSATTARLMRCANALW